MIQTWNKKKRGTGLLNYCQVSIFWTLLIYFTTNVTGFAQNIDNIERSKSPNILFIYTDDQAPWGVGAYGNKDVQTPNIDKLADQGALFENAFVTTPVCSPARAVLLTGQYSFRTGITDFIHFLREPELGLSTEYPTWPQLLQKSGYKTGLFGKWHLGETQTNHPKKFGYDEFFGFLGGGTTTMDPLLEVEGEQKIIQGSTPHILTDAAINFIKKNQDTPTLTSLHFRAPHVPYGPVPERYDTLFSDGNVQLPNYAVNPDWAQKTLIAYYKSIATIDYNVGRLLDALKELNLEDNTIVIFTSDHGYMIGHNGVYGKGTASVAGLDIRSGERRPNMFDNAIRVPLLIRWPGVIEPGSTISEMITHLDFFPTLLSIAGAEYEIPDGYPVHGLDFSPLLRGEKIPWRKAIYGDYDMYHYVKDSMRMIRTEEWKLVIHSNPEYGPELYNLMRDPEEKENVIGRENFEVMKSLRNQLYKWQIWVDDPNRIAPWEKM